MFTFFECSSHFSSNTWDLIYKIIKLIPRECLEKYTIGKCWRLVSLITQDGDGWLLLMHFNGIIYLQFTGIAYLCELISEFCTSETNQMGLLTSIFESLHPFDRLQNGSAIGVLLNMFDCML